MDRFSINFFLLIILTLITLQARADGSGTVFFLDSSSHHYFRHRHSDVSSETTSLLLNEVGAAVSVLLGFAPSASLSTASSDKLNEVLIPNPFERPHAVFMLEINGPEGMETVLGSSSDAFHNSLRSGVVFGDSEVQIQLPGADEVSVFSLNNPLDSEKKCSDRELTAFASWLGGLYVSNDAEPLSGELTIPLPHGVQIKLHMSKKGDREFVTGLVSLIENIQRAVEMHEDLSRSKRNPSELVSGLFDGIQNLQEHYGKDGIVQQGAELLVASLAKIFDSLQTAYKGQIVGVILFNGAPPPKKETVFNVMFTSQPSPRLLEETKAPLDSTVVSEMAFVRRTLAWITGIILLISTLLGTYYLLNMPLTRDTLLYSNVKLD